MIEVFIKAVNDSNGQDLLEEGGGKGLLTDSNGQDLLEEGGGKGLLTVCDWWSKMVVES